MGVSPPASSAFFITIHPRKSKPAFSQRFVSAPAMEDLHPLLHTGGYPPLCSIDTRLGHRLHLVFMPAPPGISIAFSPHPVSGWGFFVGNSGRVYRPAVAKGPLLKEVIFYVNQSSFHFFRKAPGAECSHDRPVCGDLLSIFIY